jgi:mannose-6-phosphate isomerase
MVKDNFYKLKGTIQHYQWGGKHFIPALLNINNDAQQPFAEYWLGAHDNAPALLDNNTDLKTTLQNTSLLGKYVADVFGRLPYLLKVLDVKDMLSIQVHPSKQAALKAFEAENAAGIALTAANRNYKDDNHKPELMTALGDFWLLHGFKAANELQLVLKNIPELNFLMPFFEEDNYKALYQKVMTMPQQQVDAQLQQLLERIIPQYLAGTLQKNNPHFWAARAAITFNNPGFIDRGIFSVYLLNLVYLKKGEAIFQDAGVLHAYLEGQNIELMANSDNVLRGGLTPKYIDVPELMKHVSFKPVVPVAIKSTPVNNNEAVYKTTAADFELSCITINAHETYTLTSATAEIFLLLQGSATVAGSNKQLLFAKGDALVNFYNNPIVLKAAENTVIYKAGVPFYN